jgi:signal peptidase
MSNGRRLIGLAACGLVALAWFVWLRPVSLGGDASYVIVHGTSMEPTFHDGDLVLATRARNYSKGDIVVYRVGGQFNDPAMVIHRIVGGNAKQGFTTRGDNRDRTDPWHPKYANVIGATSVHVPYAGRIAEQVRQPWVFAALGVAVVVFDGSRRRRKRRAIVRRRRVAAPSYVAWRMPPGEPS